MSSLPSGVTRGNEEIPNTYDFDGSSPTAMLAVDGTIVNNLLRSNTSLVFSTWIQITDSQTTYIYCMGRELRNYRHFCIFYRGRTASIDLYYQRQYRPGIDVEEREILQSVRVAFNPTPETTFINGGWHFYLLRLTYRPDGDITLEMFIDGIVMEAFVLRYRDAVSDEINVHIPDPRIVTLPFRPEPVSTEATDMVAFIGGRFNKPTLNLHGRLGRVLIFPYLIDTASLNCYTSCNELLFISGDISTAITTSYNGVNRALSFSGAAPLTDYITLLQEIAFSTSNPVSGTKRYVRLQVSSHVINSGILQTSTDSVLKIRVEHWSVIYSKLEHYYGLSLIGSHLLSYK